MSQKGFLERILSSKSKKVVQNQDDLKAKMRERLLNIVYEEELADELLPVFMNLQHEEGFSMVLELLETKENQIEVISGGDWFKQESKPDKLIQEDEEVDESGMVDEILKNKYEVK